MLILHAFLFGKIDNNNNNNNNNNNFVMAQPPKYHHPNVFSSFIHQKLALPKFCAIRYQFFCKWAIHALTGGVVLVHQFSQLRTSMVVESFAMFCLSLKFAFTCINTQMKIHL